MTIRAEAIFCDDMRSEANGKIILIGVYRHYMGPMTKSLSAHSVLGARTATSMAISRSTVAIITMASMPSV